MKQYFNLLRQLITVVAVAVVAASCNDQWNDHYSTGGGHGSSGNVSIADRLSQMDDASKFVKALKTTKMLKVNDDTLGVSFYDFLCSDQFVTVWVPSDAADIEWDLFTKTGKTRAEHEYTAKRLIMNHIARFGYSLGSGNRVVKMMNDKSHVAEGTNSIDGTLYACDSENKAIVNEPCKNGIIHQLAKKSSGFINYYPTIYEFLISDKKYGYATLLGEFLERYTIEELDEGASVSSGLDDEGNMVYIDSVTYKYNSLFSLLMAKIDVEDSSYVLVLPSADGWKSQFDSAWAQFTYGNIPEADSLQRVWSHISLIRDAFFNMNIQKSPIDSVCSTLYSYYNRNYDTYKSKYNKYFQPYDKNNGLFYKGLIDSVICSNGKIYITDKWNFDKYMVYDRLINADQYYSTKYIMVEPEEAIKAGENGTLLSEVPNLHASDGYALRIAGRPVSLAWEYSFIVPDVLKGDYRLKLVVVTNDQEDESEYKPIKIHPTVSFYKDGNVKNSATNNKMVIVNEYNGRRPKDYPTTSVVHACDTIVIDKIVSVPFATYGQKNGSLVVSIKNNAGTNQSYSPFVFLDRIILEPVKE